MFINFRSEEMSDILFKSERRVHSNKYKGFLDSNGLKWVGPGNDRHFQIRLFNGNEPTLFGSLLLEDVDNDKEKLLLTSNEVINISDGKWYFVREKEWISDYFIRCRFIYGEDDGRGIFQGLISNNPEKYISMFERKLHFCERLFKEKQDFILSQKKKFGDNVNNTLISLGATEDEIHYYWEYILDKKNVKPLIYMGCLNYMSRELLLFDKGVLLQCLSSESIEDIDIMLGSTFLPRDLINAKSIIASYIETRFNSSNDEEFSTF